MARVIVTTDDGREVWTFHETVDVHTALCIPSAPHNIKTHTLLMGLGRAIRDAESIAAGNDPERPSEKAMRLAEDARRKGAALTENLADDDPQKVKAADA